MTRRILVGVAFLTAIVAVAVGGHAYLAWRLLLEPQWPQPVRGLLLASLAGVFVLLSLRLFSRRRIAWVASRAGAWTAYVWLGFAFLLLTATLASDAVVWILGAAEPVGSEAALALARARALAVVLFAAAAGVVALREGLAPPRVKRVEIPLRRWPETLDGLRVVQVSDIHLGPLLDRRFARALVERVTALAPDLVAVTGDLVDGRVSRLRDEVEPLRALRAPLGVYFVTGNHDYYSGARDWAAVAESLGWTVLRNRSVGVDAGRGRFHVAGVDDAHGSLLDPGGGEDLEGALAEVDPELPVLLLAHDPTTFRRAARRGVDLQLSGHTHGGQMWPFHAVVRLFVRWVAGLHRVNGSVLYVSRGTGFWGPPMRLLAPAEITEIVLRSGAA